MFLFCTRLWCEQGFCAEEGENGAGASFFLLDKVVLNRNIYAIKLESSLPDKKPESHVDNIFDKAKGFVAAFAGVSSKNSPALTGANAMLSLVRVAGEGFCKVASLGWNLRFSQYMQ